MRRIKELGIVFCIVVALFACAIVLPCSCSSTLRETTARDVFLMSMTSIGIGMHLYHQENGQLPPAIVRDKEGKPLYSWRVALLPYVDQQALYKKFKLDEPWDSPHNKELATLTPFPYSSPLDAPGLTCFQVLIGPGTAFEKPGLTLKDFPDGTSNTILVVEAKESVPWSKPIDLVYEPNGKLPKFGSRFRIPRFFLHCRLEGVRGFEVCFADLGRSSIPSDTDERIIRALITRDGGEKESREDLRR